MTKWKNRYNEIHSMKGSRAKYPRLDREFPYMPAYMRRSIVADALGMVKSYRSNHENWEKMSPAERGSEPVIGIPSRYELTFYDQERDMCRLEKGTIGLKLYDGKSRGWHYFRISASDAKYISALVSHCKLLSPVVEKVRGKYHTRFSFSEEKDLVSAENQLSYVILAVDLGINAPASWAVMTSDGTVHAKGLIHLAREEDILNHRMNRKRMYQQEGKKPNGIYRLVTNANLDLSIKTSREIFRVADLYSVDCIVFEHLDRPKKGKHGRGYRERIHIPGENK